MFYQINGYGFSEAAKVPYILWDISNLHQAPL